MNFFSKKYCAVFIVFSSNFFLAKSQPWQNNSEKNSFVTHALVKKFFETQASVKYIYQCTINKSATVIAWCADHDNGQSIYLKLVKKNDSLIHITANDSLNKFCNESEPQFSPDGKKIAFLSDTKTKGQPQIFIADAFTGKLISQQPITDFDGYISHLQWSPDEKFLSVLYVEKASRNPNPMAALNRNVGLIDSSINKNVQRIAVVDLSGYQTKIITPLPLYIFEYNWSPDSKFFCYTAAPPPGDDNWYIAKLYKQNLLNSDTVCIYKPQFQIAVPCWSPDGKHIAFIEGLMSDQGGTGGEIYIIDTIKNSLPKNLTPNRNSTPSWFTWQPDGNILFSEFVGGSVAISSLNTNTLLTQTLWYADESIRAGNEETSLSVTNNKAETTFALIRSSWNKLPEVWYGDFKKQAQVTHLNDSIQKPLLRFENVTWTNDYKHVQGWLLFPANYDSTKKYSMLVCVHGGPAWIATPTWAAPDFNTTVYTQLGYFVLFPNARGSYGQGENFTLADRKNWGFGDLRDILSGIDAAINKYSIDSNRIGILGWSYGGSMAMISVTQTNRFKAAVAGAGACDWKSYYGQNAIDKWMNSYFNASPYNDPEAYEKVSAITYIRQAKTPTLVLVGERDGESPPPQSFEFWHALKELDVPTQLYVYPDEGHEFENFDNMIDVSVRTIEWFNLHMPGR